MRRIERRLPVVHRFALTLHGRSPGRLVAAIIAALGIQGRPTLAAPADGSLDCSVLPILEPSYPPITELDARKVTPPPVFEVKAPAGAPNMLVILIDDMGFGMPSTFGGPVRMPTADRLASEELRYNQFHTTALCSPTRTALLSGRNHHSNSMRSITETATAFPGTSGKRPDSVAPLAEMLRLAGYSASFFGKNHETATWEIGISGPTTRWPNRSGFGEFYWFTSLDDARRKLEAYRVDYNEVRPHSALDNKTPNEFARSLTGLAHSAIQ